MAKPDGDASKPKSGSKSEVIFNACKRKGGASVHELQELTGLGGVVYKYPKDPARKCGLKLVVAKRKGEGDSKREVTVFARV